MEEGGPDGSVSNNKLSSVILNELAMKARENYCNFNNSARQSIKNDYMKGPGNATIK